VRGEAGVSNPNFFLHISSSWVERNLHTEFQLHWMSISGRFMVGGATKNNNNISIELMAFFLRFGNFYFELFSLHYGLIFCCY
jgi:hypothetical protein